MCVCVYLEKEMVTHFNISCLENSMDRGAGNATVHGVEKSRTWLSMCKPCCFFFSCHAVQHAELPLTRDQTCAPCSESTVFKKFFYLFMAAVAVARGLRSCDSRLQSSCSIVVVHEISYSVARGIFLDQGLNLRLLYWQLDFFFPVSYQGSLKA